MSTTSFEGKVCIDKMCVRSPVERLETTAAASFEDMNEETTPSVGVGWPKYSGARWIEVCDVQSDEEMVQNKASLGDKETFVGTSNNSQFVHRLWKGPLRSLPPLRPGNVRAGWFHCSSSCKSGLHTLCQSRRTQLWPGLTPLVSVYHRWKTVLLFVCGYQMCRRDRQVDLDDCRLAWRVQWNLLHDYQTTS